MARLKSAPRRRRSPLRPDAAGGEDRLSSLPDALLRRVLSCLDTRTALSTAVLSRRWARLVRDLPTLRRALDRRRRARDIDGKGKLLRYIKRCDRRAMRAFLDGVAGILDAPPSGGARRRRANALYLEFFRTYDGAGIIDRMIETAVGEWGVQHLDVVVLRSAPRDPPLPAYVFPDHLLDDERHRSRLRSLTLGHCVLPPLHRYAALQRLVLQDTPASTPMHAYDAVFHGGCGAALRVVHLLCCRGASDVLEIDAPCSGVEELVVDSCSFRAIELRELPELRHFACLGDETAPVVVELSFGTVPRLTHVNLTLTFSASTSPATPHRVLDSLLGGAPASMSRLAVRFTGPKRWILPRPLDTTLLGLRELLVADVPPTWDISWPRLLLEASPALETLHIHVAAGDGGSCSSSPADEHQGGPIYWQPRRKFRHQQLREVCMVGFANTPRQTRFLRYLVRVCKALERVVLVREGRVEEDGLWGWKTVVEQRDRPWTLADWISVSAEIKHGRRWSKPHVEVTLV
ncbi:hypothetical protein BDA96_08G079600 [Sorghum bicolor]|uniref:F-box domain-containing protein n=2 Tax=Sorghum bicolor TaxID=4558 RepID=C5YTN8_SORBI|nr:hypothetical protein SORBI_3008G074200 [Sorghum bicolor]KAG0520503.1 hypothetical protein BDA96_08G079600 [Sorghum bicolor]